MFHEDSYSTDSFSTDSFAITMLIVPPKSSNGGGYTYKAPPKHLPLADQNPYLTQALLEDEEILLILGYYYNDKM